jgi:hypothetical protein
MKWLAYIALLLIVHKGQAATYISAEDFVSQSFAAQPALDTVWITADMQAVASEVLGHPYKGLRVRYWHSERRSVWILDEIGKEKPITIGVVIEEDRVIGVSILAFRESRGWEVRHPFFTEQFRNLRLSSEWGLSGPIDGISGATMSVNAVTNVTRFALYLHQAVMKPQNNIADVGEPDG